MEKKKKFYIIFFHIKKLVSKKGSLNLLNKEKKHPIHIACDNNTLEIIKFLVEKKSNVNSSNNSPLHHACKNKNISLEVVQFLIQNNAKLDHKNEHFRTPLEYASFNQLLIDQVKQKYGDQTTIETAFNSINDESCIIL